MKGIAHFAAGVAAASFFPGAVEAGANGNPLYFVLGGVFGLLPDTIDFKFYRFFVRHTGQISPDPGLSVEDLQKTADGVAEAFNRALVSGRPVMLRLNTIRLGADLWQQYRVRFNVADRKVHVEYGPAVDTGGMPVSNKVPFKGKKGTASLPCSARFDYTAAVTVDILDGPILRMAPAGDSEVIVEFIPWHREWSHGFVACLLFALGGTLIWGTLAGLVILTAGGAHVLMDQLGFMGSGLLFPFHKRRVKGLKLLHSNAALPNFAAVWLSCLLIFWNLLKAAESNVYGVSFSKVLSYGIAIPACIAVLIMYIARADLVARWHTKTGATYEETSDRE
jgi:membrane-bound metal-dependent hydrolase YbcI (DUF457 family)